MTSKFHDPHLTPLLRSCTTDELAPLQGYITSASTHTFGSATEEYFYTSAHEGLVDDIVHEIRTFGGNSLANVLRPSGVPYAEVARDVAAKLRAKAGDGATVEELERAVLNKLLDDSVAKMTSDERSAFQAELQRAGAKNLEVRAGVPIAVALAQAGVSFSGFLAYKVAVIVANAVAKAVLGKGLSFAANAALTRGLAAAAGPIGWVVSGVWTAVEVSGPAYRVTIPCVCHISMLRLQREVGDMADA